MATSMYDPNPIDPNAPVEEDETPPDLSIPPTDYSYLVPNVTVQWDALPSFNTDPPGSGGGGVSDTMADSGPFRVVLGSLRTMEENMMSHIRSTISEFDALKALASTGQDTIYGQNDTDWIKDPTYYATQVIETPSPIQGMARMFAHEMIPAQQRALGQIANVIELLGEYVGAVNRTGQTYGQIDRAAKFPEPPPLS
ncbi:hypothetical protein [Streptomyces sp. NPDC001380]|uniref:hypothetical protein n=1 Tax=Streptomyces sp. NPDC001380 TaxID=3364566 RepID=UPI0036930A3B